MTQPATVPLARAPLGEPLSLAEELFWTAERRGAAAPPFVECPRHLPIVLHLSGGADAGALSSALREIVRRHEPLRSTFHETPSGPTRVARAPDLWPDDDVRVPANVDPGWIHRLLQDELERPFDLEAGPPVRARLWRLGEREHVLSIVAHHVVFDGWSVGVLLRELGALYGRFSGAGGDALPEPRVRYADYVARQRTALESPAARRAVEYWREHLRGAAGLALAERGGIATPDAPSAAERFTIDRERTACLRRLGQERRFTFAVVLATLFALLLRRRTGSADVVVGMPVVDRPLGQFDELVGLFLNMVILRTDLGGDPGVGRALARVRDTFRGAYLHGHLPYAALCRAIPEAERLPRVVFNLLNFRRVAPALPGLAVRHVPVETRLPALADLSLHVGEDDGALSGRFIYKTSAFPAEDVRGMARELDALVDEALSEQAVEAVT